MGGWEGGGGGGGNGGGRALLRSYLVCGDREREREREYPRCPPAPADRCGDLD